jgi:hypothetical protein
VKFHRQWPLVLVKVSCIQGRIMGSEEYDLMGNGLSEYVAGERSWSI